MKQGIVKGGSKWTQRCAIKSLEKTIASSSVDCVVSLKCFPRWICSLTRLCFRCKNHYYYTETAPETHPKTKTQAKAKAKTTPTWVALMLCKKLAATDTLGSSIADDLQILAQIFSGDICSVK